MIHISTSIGIFIIKIVIEFQMERVMGKLIELKEAQQEKCCSS